jgi:hypothetical protein
MVFIIAVGMAKTNEILVITNTKYNMSLCPTLFFSVSAVGNKSKIKKLPPAKMMESQKIASGLKFIISNVSFL